MSDRTVIVALDYSSPDQALQFVTKISPDKCAVKVGFELFTVGGPQLVEDLMSKHFRIFLDLKFHDIPNTVAKACMAAAKMGVWMLNVHASGGAEMLLAAREAIDKQPSGERPILLAVTVLTSLNQRALQEIGISGNLQTVVNNWAMLARNCGLDGVVSSAQEAALIRSQSDDNFIVVTPGIRLPTNTADDQKRIVTPSDARKVGATHIVVGRPITQALDPNCALTAFYEAFVSA